MRVPDLDHPDELRVDLDPTPEASWDDVRQVALVVGQVLSDHGLTGFPKTSGSRGIHVNVRVKPEHDFIAVRRAAIALAREVERRAPEIATSKWWKEERHGVFVDYNQNARDRTVASAYSVRPTPDARVSTPLSWPEVADVEAAELRIDTVPALVARRGDPHADIDAHAGSLDGLLELPRARSGRRPAGRALAAALPQAGRRATARSAQPRAEGLNDAAQSCIWASLHSAGGLSSRQRRIFVPWRMRPSEA